MTTPEQRTTVHTFRDDALGESSSPWRTDRPWRRIEDQPAA